MPEAKTKWFEKEKFGAFWERSYRQRGLSSMGGPSHEVIECTPALRPGGKVCDLGCGEGRNALYLASLGFDVLAVDRSEAGIGKLAAVAYEAGIPLKTKVCDIREFRFETQYDLVMGHGVLYYLAPAEWRTLVEQAKACTNPGGLNIYTVFVFDRNFPCPDQFSSAGYLGSLKNGELRETYAGWEILRWDEYVKWDEHPGVGEHYHPIEKLVARKPGASSPRAEIERYGTNAVLNEQVFHAVKCGTPGNEVLKHLGEPLNRDEYVAEGPQFGPLEETVQGYTLELWYYGNHAYYLTNGRVSGRALLRSPGSRVVFPK